MAILYPWLLSLATASDSGLGFTIPRMPWPLVGNEANLSSIRGDKNFEAFPGVELEVAGGNQVKRVPVVTVGSPFTGAGHIAVPAVRDSKDGLSVTTPG
jgi:hypothetical protein